MSDVISMQQWRRDRAARGKLVVDDRTGLITGRPRTMSEPEFSDRLTRIRASLDKINRMMADLREMNRERGGYNARD